MIRTTLPRLSLLARRNPPHPRLVLHPEVQDALLSRSSTSQPATPIVALESTIITHGMPYPTNLSTARRVEEMVRSQGAVPATMALLDGKIHVGCTEEQLQRLAESAEKKGAAVKTGRRDLANVLAAGVVGGTTVSGTALVAHLAGISIFATGGIGGVHRGAERSFDISSDLTELSRTPIAVFCSGAKSILDIPLTLEYLETQGVSTYSFNLSGEFPAFYTAKSGYYVPSIQDERRAAEVILQGEEYGLQSGSVFGVPIPSECEAEGEKIQKAVEMAVFEAKQLGVDKKGKEVTPWLLARVGQLTDGGSLKSNVELVVNNAKVAARTAKEYEALRSEMVREEGKGKLYIGNGTGGTSDRYERPKDSTSPNVIIFGCAALDVVSRSDAISPASTSRGSVRFSLGGVGRNIAEAAHKILAPSNRGKHVSAQSIRMVAPLADDPAGALVQSGLQKLGMDVTGCFVPASSSSSGRRSPVCSLHLDGGNDLITGVADMALVEEALSKEVITEELRGLADRQERSIIAFDANLNVEAMSTLLRTKESLRLHHHRCTPLLFFEPTSTSKCTRIMDAICSSYPSVVSKERSERPAIDLATPNLIELKAMVQRAVELGLLEEREVPSSKAQDLDETSHIQALCTSLGPFISTFLVTMGERGVMSAMRRHPSSPELIFRHHPPPAPSKLSLTQSSSPSEEGEVVTVQVKSTTGAGDSFAGGVLATLSHLLELSAHNARDGDASLSLTLLDPEWVHLAVQVGQRAAVLTLQSEEAVAEDLAECHDLLFAKRARDLSGDVLTLAQGSDGEEGEVVGRTKGLPSST